MRRPAPPGRQRGVALLIALVLMALATILAVKIGFGGIVERKRTTTMLAAEQAFQFGLGAEALAADVLTRQSQPNQQVTLADPWAQTPEPIPLRPPNDPEGEPMGTLEGSLQDESGKFNINTLLRVDPNTGQPDPVPLAQFTALLQLLGLEPKWAALARDWIDADGQETFPDGAEDSVYTSQDTPYLTGNWPMMSTTELMSLPGFGAERYQKLAPYITALPNTKTEINTCTAPGVVLDMLSGNDEWTRNTDTLIANRKLRCFPSKSDLLATIQSRVEHDKVEPLLSEKSDYFRLTTRVTLGSTEFTLYSLLVRASGGTKFTPVLRSFGTL